MSNSGSSSSTPEITEEDNQGKTPEIKPEDNGVNTKDTNKEDGQGNNTQDQEIKKEKIEVKVTDEKAVKTIRDLFIPSVCKIILTGKPGTGKTWIARQIYKHVLKETPEAEPIWICLDKKHDEKSLFDTVARQFCLPTSADDREDNDDNDEKREVTEFERSREKMQRLKEKMQERLKAAKKEGKFLLMVLDGDQFDILTGKDQEEEVGIENYVNNLLGANYGEQFKVLITRRRSEDGDDSEKLQKVEVEPLSGKEALKLFRENVNLLRRSDRFKKVSDAIGAKVDNISPAEVLIIAGTLSFIAEDTSENWELKLAIEAATNGLDQFLRYMYDKEPGKSCLVDCFWHSWQFLQKHGGVHFNELITNWIMEGHITVKPTDQIEKAYENGYRILSQLTDCHMLKMKEDNVIFLERAILNMNEYCRRGYSGTADPGLASVLKDCERTVLEGITPADGMMKTLCNDAKEHMISSLLIDGSRLCREGHKTFFEAKLNLNLLAILYPRLESPDELFISGMKELHVLMLRRAHLLKRVNEIENLKLLTVLEISGSTSLPVIPESFFKAVSQLRSLELSALGIKLLPDDFSDLIELRRLILSKCSSLKELPKLVKLTKLEVIDLSECTSLEKIQEKSFKILENLQVIDFSQTKIEKLPIVRTLKRLQIILLKGCSKLAGMRTVKDVSSLKILDLSGAANIREIMYDSFEGADDIRELDLSGTQIQFLFLPPNICKLQKLRLKDCSNLKDLPELKELGSLEELDISGCTSLQLNLPDLTPLENLKILCVKGCNQLENLPAGLESLSKLEELDISGCTSLQLNLPDLTPLENLKILCVKGCNQLENLPAGLEFLSKLEELDLSDCTSLLNLPDLTALENLKILSLKDCVKLQSLPAGLESLSKLEKLDIRGTNLWSEDMTKSLNRITQLEILH